MAGSIAWRRVSHLRCCASSDLELAEMNDLHRLAGFVHAPESEVNDSRRLSRTQFTSSL